MCYYLSAKSILMPVNLRFFMRHYLSAKSIHTKIKRNPHKRIHRNQPQSIFQPGFMLQWVLSIRIFLWDTNFEIRNKPQKKTLPLYLLKKNQYLER